jgi:molybdopterin-guanine dinucleotide biosynthesis protein A
MGTDKALLPFRGRPLVEHALEILRGAGIRASIAGARSPLESFAAGV